MQIPSNKELVDAKIKEIKELYEVRSFKTTTESIQFTRKIAKSMVGIGTTIDENSSEDISKILDFFEPELIEYVISNFVLKRTDEESVEIDYESEFIGDFETLSILFGIAIEFLMSKANGTGKQKVQNHQNKITTTKR